eukprot:113648_1
MRARKVRWKRTELFYGLLLLILFLSWFILYRTCSIDAYDNHLNTTPTSQIMHPLSSSHSELLYGLSKGITIRRKNFKRLNAQNKRLRVIFIVGVEGVGHHLWEDIFDQLSTYSSNIVIDKYHTKSKKQASTKLQPCLLQCFSASIWSQKSTTNTLKSSLSTNCPSCAQNMNNSCDCVLVEIQKYSKRLASDSILFLNHAMSYAFWDQNIRNHPDLNLFIDYFEGDTFDNMRNIFDVRLIVMKRDYVNAMVSSCVHRFSGCMRRIELLHTMLSVIQSQLMSIDTQFWIMLDYDDVVKRKEEYVGIISDWIGIKQEFVRNALRDAIKVKKKKEGVHLYKGIERTAWDKLRYDVTDNKDRYAYKAMKTIFYEQGKYQWPIFNSSYFLVTPANRAFLDSKYHMLTTH